MLVLEAYNAQTGKMQVFHYAPDLAHLPMIRRCCNMVEEIDEHNKAVMALKAEADKWQIKEGECK